MDCSSINNWRPISLLSLQYKLCASALANRIKPIIDNICSANQHGFSSTRPIHCNVINLLDSIHAANASNDNSFLFSTDFFKAFDSVNHNYILEALKTFNFGPVFCRMIKTCLSGKTGGIISSSGGIGPSFTFNQGTGQGDPLSTYLFLISIEILIIKLETSKRLEPVISVVNNLFSYKIPRVFAFADDITVLLKLNSSNVSSLLNIFHSFELISDLRLNKAKCEIMILGLTKKTPFFIRNIGCNIVQKIKTLGFTIDQDISNLQNNFDYVYFKISKIFDYWSKFKLSVFRRKTVALTYGLSQIAYFGTVFSPTREQIDELESLFSKFVLGKEKISKDRTFFSTRRGGMGLPSIRLFIQSLQVGLYNKMCKPNNTSMCAVVSRKVTNAILHNFDTRSPILTLFPFTKKILTNLDSWRLDLPVNYRTFNLLPVFNISHPGVGYVSTKDISIRTAVHNSLSNITMGLISPNKLVLQFKDCRDLINSSLTLVEYFRLRNVVNKIIKNASFTPNLTHIRSFRHLLMSTQKGSKKFRNLIEWKFEHKNTWATKKCITYNFDYMSRHHFDVPGWEFMKYNHLPNEFKQIYLRFLNNTLWLGSQLSKFNKEVDSRCSICKQIQYLPCGKDDKQHVFQNCPVLCEVRSLFNSWLFLLEIPELNFSNFNNEGVSMKHENNSIERLTMIII